MKKVYLVKNLFEYEKVTPPPLNLPENMITVYVTDSEENSFEAKRLGWNYSTVTKKFSDASSAAEKRMAVAYINCFPHNFIEQDVKHDFIFVSDSNILSLFNNYRFFVEQCSYDHCLFVTSGYYRNEDDNIKSELGRSDQERWKVFYRDIKSRTRFYLSEFKRKDIDYKKVRVSSAKYIGWDSGHKEFYFLSNFLYNEYSKNIQGNIVLSYIKTMYPEIVKDYYVEDLLGGILQDHNHYHY